MRNLKKVLALVLALVMSLSLVTIANAADFSDSADINYDEAVDVMVAAGIIDGVGNNSFDPNGTLTREQAAKLITYMLLGENSDKLGTEGTSFKDVAATRWSAPAIEYCATMGIIDGAGDGNFYPAGKLTGYAFAKMLLTAIGYKSDREGFTGNSWTLNVATKALSEDVRLDKGMEKMFGSAEISRQEAAQMALNAIKAPLVEYDNDNTIAVNGATVQINGGSAKFVTTTIARQQNISRRTLTNAGINSQNTGYTVEFGERYLPKLELKEDVDAFGRPSYTWTYDKKEVGTYIDKDLLDKEFTTEITGKDVYDFLGSNIVDDYSFRITIDGVEVDQKTGSADNNTVLKAKGAKGPNAYFDETYFTKTYKSAIGATGNGTLTQIFVDSASKHVDIAVINTFLAKATADYSAKKDEVNFKVYALAKTNSGSNTVYFKYEEAYKTDKEQAETLTVSGEDFAIEDVKKDDIVLVTVSNGEIKTIAQPEVLSAVELSAFSKDNYVINDGKQYDYAATTEYDVDTLEEYTSVGSTQQLKDAQYNVYLDTYGYMVGIEEVDAVKNYIFLTGIDQGTSNLKNKTADAAGILLDGTFVEFSMDMKDSKKADNKTFEAGPLWNTWCTYTADKDGVYTLTEVKDLAAMNKKDSKEKAGQYHDADYSDKDIDDKHVSLKSSDNGRGDKTYVYGNDNTVYIVAELDAVTSDTQINRGKIDMPVSGARPGDPDVAGKNTLVSKSSTKVGIISGVDSVATGIANVNLNTWTAAEILNEVPTAGAAYSGNVYTLFDDDGYVIAAVVIGEDDGTSKNLVYSNNDKISKEEYSKADDEWTWERKVISNGEEITLTEKGDKTSVLKSLDENVWYEITYKADGTVKSAKYAYYTEDGKRVGATASDNTTDPVGPALDRTDSATDPTKAHDFVDDVTYIENAINESNKTTVLYEQVWGRGDDDDGSTIGTAMGENNAPSLKGSTLYVDTNASKGFYVSKDVKTVLIQKNDGKSETIYGEGTSDLENILDDLNFNDKTGYKSYCFKISAILTNGRATLVVIHDWNEEGATQSGTHTPGNVTAGLTWVDTDEDNGFANPKWHGDSTPTIDDIFTMLENEGCTDIEKSGGNWNFTDRNGRRYTNAPIAAGASEKRYAVTVDGHTTYWDDTDSAAWSGANGLLGEDYDQEKHGVYAFKVGGNKNNTGDFVQITGTYTVPANDVEFETGYLTNTGMTPESAQEAVNEIEVVGGALAGDQSAINSAVGANTWMNMNAGLRTSITDNGDGTGTVNVTGAINTSDTNKFTGAPWYFGADEGDTSDHFIVIVGLKLPEGAHSAKRLGNPSDKEYKSITDGLSVGVLVPYEDGVGGTVTLRFEWFADVNCTVSMGITEYTVDASGVTVTYTP